MTNKKLFNLLTNTLHLTFLEEIPSDCLLIVDGLGFMIQIFNKLNFQQIPEFNFNVILSSEITNEVNKLQLMHFSLQFYFDSQKYWIQELEEKWKNLCCDEDVSISTFPYDKIISIFLSLQLHVHFCIDDCEEEIILACQKAKEENKSVYCYCHDRFQFFSFFFFLFLIFLFFSDLLLMKDCPLISFNLFKLQLQIKLKQMFGEKIIFVLH